MRWQGRCRELFLREHAPELADRLVADLALVTLRVSCDYLAELSAFDEVALRMRLGALARNRMTLQFEYWRVDDAGEELVARGEQQIACMRRSGSGLTPEPIPEALLEALRPFRGEP